MNPRHWKREHQLAWALVSLIGGMFGMLVAWSSSPLYRVGYGGGYFAALPFDWLLDVFSHWPWPVFGAFIAGATFYTVRLLQIANQATIAAVVEQQPTDERLGEDLKKLWRRGQHVATTVFGYALWGTIIVVFALELLQKLLGRL